MLRFSAALSLLVIATAVDAGDVREFCADRPGLGTPACTLDPGRAMLELGLADWTRERDAEARTDTLLAGDVLARIGLTPRLEAQLGWTSYGHVRTRDRTTGAVQTMSRVGDVTFALRRNLRNPDGSGTAIAIMPYATIPVGRTPIGAGTWGAGLLMPVSFSLPSDFSLALTPSVAAAPDSDGAGRHLAIGGVVGIGFRVIDTVSGGVELSVVRDNDPDRHATELLGGLSLGWQPSDDMQLDFGLNFGLNSASPDSQLYFGIARRF